MKTLVKLKFKIGEVALRRTLDPNRKKEFLIKYAELVVNWKFPKGLVFYREGDGPGYPRVEEACLQKKVRSKK